MSSDSSEYFDAIVVGAGFAGMYMLHKLRESGFTAHVFEVGTDVGGTWYWNRYPGARCDVPSMEYSYQFSDELQQEWEWSEKYATQPEILRYASHVADRFDLRRDITFNTRVESVTWNGDTRRWTVRTHTGRTCTAQFVMMATGCLSSTNEPDIDGKEAFNGPTYHTGKWPHDGVDFSGKRVAVIGTGSSAIQSIPLIAEQADHLTVFQRTANYSVPAHNRPLSTDEVARIKANYREFRALNSSMPSAFGGTIPRGEAPALSVDDAERERIFEERWDIGGLSFLGGFSDLILSTDANETAAEFVRRKIRSIVRDETVAELLSPKQVIGCKRLCVDTNYYDTFNRDNVSLVDISTTPISRITPRGVCVGDTEYEVDAIVFATGFDAMTGTLLRIDIQGRDGYPLREHWQAGPRTYLGLGMAGFPNLFTISGPGSPSVLSNMIVSIEQHVEWINDCVSYLRAEGLESIEAKAPSEDEWIEFVNVVANFTLYPTCNSWYLGANVPGKPRIFMPLLGFPTYVDKCNDVVAKNYEGFALA
jgi:cyclohexanone monooxygenase